MRCGRNGRRSAEPCSHTPEVGAQGMSRSDDFSNAFACPTFLRQTVVEWTNQSIGFSFWARAYYQMQKDRGKTHQVVLRALAFKWIRILFRCWKNRTPYGESKNLMALQQKGSILLKTIAQS